MTKRSIQCTSRTRTGNCLGMLLLMFLVFSLVVAVPALAADETELETGDGLIVVDPNGGVWNGSAEKQVIVVSDGSVGDIPKPTRVGYIFTGWTYIRDLDNGTIIMTACWAEDENAGSFIIIDPNGGIWNGSSEKQKFSVTDGSVGSIPNPTRSGYIFAGWKYVRTTSEDGYGARITMKAEWISGDVEITGIKLKYLDSNGVMQTITDLNNVPYGVTVYVYHTYRNNSESAVTVNGYYDDSTGVVNYAGTTDFTIEAGQSMTVLATQFVAKLGPGSITGYVYIDGYDFGDTSAETDGSNNAKTLNYTVTFDIELVEVYLADTDGNRYDADRIPVDSEVYVHYVFRNNSAGAVSVDYYYNSAKRGSVSALAGNGTLDVVVTSFTATTPGTYRISGEIYRAGMTAATELYEPNLANNTNANGNGGVLDSYTVVDAPTVDPGDGDFTYRTGTEVITSFTLANDSDVDYTPDNALTVTMQVYNSAGTLVAEMTKDVIVPANESQLVWFKWTTPDEAGSYKIVMSVDIGETSREVELTCVVVSSDPVYSTDTTYENQPTTWIQPIRPTGDTDSASWSVWEYDDGEFTKVTYGISASGSVAYVKPSSVTAYQQYGVWYMKSGYGFKVYAGNAVIGSLSGCVMPDAEDYTSAQWAYALFPEFNYDEDEQTTLMLVDGLWVFCEQDGNGLHYTPIWYPDSTGTGTMYYMKLIQTDIWTPVGVLTVTVPVDGIWIEGDVYDDWYTS